MCVHLLLCYCFDAVIVASAVVIVATAVIVVSAVVIVAAAVFCESSVITLISVRQKFTPLKLNAVFRSVSESELKQMPNKCILRRVKLG